VDKHGQLSKRDNMESDDDAKGEMLTNLGNDDADGSAAAETSDAP